MAYDDYEQGERVREWLRNNGVAILAGIVIGLALFFGYRAWKAHRANETRAAATQYQLIETAMATGQSTQAEAITDSLIKNHAGSTYAVLAATLRARRELDAGKRDDAIKTLTWAAGHADPGPLQDLTRLRLARAQFDAGQADATLATLKVIPAGSYTGLVDELRGDAQVKLGHASAAMAAYRSALAAFDPASPQRHLVEMKIDNIAPAPTAAPAAAKSVPAAPSSSHKQDA